MKLFRKRERYDSTPRLFTGELIPSRRGYKAKHIVSMNNIGVMTEKVTYTRFLDDERSSVSIFKALFIVLFMVSFFNAVSGNGRIITFTGLLNALSEAPSIDISWIGHFMDLTIKNDWGLFDFFRTFLNQFMGIIGLMLYFVTGVAQIVVFFSYFLGVFFGFV